MLCIVRRYNNLHLEYKTPQTQPLEGVASGLNILRYGPHQTQGLLLLSELGQAFPHTQAFNIEYQPFRRKWLNSAESLSAIRKMLCIAFLMSFF